MLELVVPGYGLWGLRRVFILTSFFAALIRLETSAMLVLVVWYVVGESVVCSAKPEL